MGLFKKEDKVQKQKMKQVEKILNENVGGLMPTAARRKFFQKMTIKGVKATNLEKVRIQVTKTIKEEVLNGELEPTTSQVNQRIDEIINENVDNKIIDKRIAKQKENIQKEKDKINNIEDKFGATLKGKEWFKCSIEEVKYSTFNNQPQRNIDTAYVIINDDNFEILKESVWLKTNMGSRRLFFNNIASIDYDARGVLHASTSVFINTKSAEHVQLKFVKPKDFELMNKRYEAYLQNSHKPSQIESVKEDKTGDTGDLLKYAELYEKGLLTREEFDEIKKKLI